MTTTPGEHVKAYAQKSMSKHAWGKHATVALTFQTLITKQSAPMKTMYVNQVCHSMHYDVLHTAPEGDFAGAGVGVGPPFVPHRPEMQIRLPSQSFIVRQESPAQWPAQEQPAAAVQDVWAKNIHFILVSPSCIS